MLYMASVHCNSLRLNHSVVDRAGDTVILIKLMVTTHTTVRRYMLCMFYYMHTAIVYISTVFSAVNPFGNCCEVEMAKSLPNCQANV